MDKEVGRLKSKGQQSTGNKWVNSKMWEFAIVGLGMAPVTRVVTDRGARTVSAIQGMSCDLR